MEQLWFEFGHEKPAVKMLLPLDTAIPKRGLTVEEVKAAIPQRPHWLEGQPIFRSPSDN